MLNTHTDRAHHTAFVGTTIFTVPDTDEKHSWSQLTLTVPQHWIVPIFNGDESGLTAAERRAYSRWRVEMAELGAHGWALPDDAEAFFAWDHEGTALGDDAGAMCYDIMVLVC